MSARASDGHWHAPCVDVHGQSAVRACASFSGTLVVFTHLAKAGGSTMGAALSAAIRAQSPLETCHVYWNGLGREAVCPKLRAWVRHGMIRQAPTLPHGGNATLASSVPFRHCSLIWLQHIDYSLVETIRRAHPRLYACSLSNEPTRSLQHSHSTNACKCVLFCQARPPSGTGAPPGGPLLFRVPLQKALPMEAARPSCSRSQQRDQLTGGDRAPSCQRYSSHIAAALPGGQLVVSRKWPDLSDRLV